MLVATIFDDRSMVARWNVVQSTRPLTLSRHPQCQYYIFKDGWYGQCPTTLVKPLDEFNENEGSERPVPILGFGL